ncbi:IL2RA protein, partial [Nothoprocta ornata]|nr:IL2RA protein [Nothoprocta pentlandii]NWX95936.1 IL2RA protein [Nothoprocta ornata]
VRQMVSCLWVLFAEECPSLQRTEFADVVEAYPLGTKLYYDCDQGYKRRSGHYLGIQCTSTHGIADWSYTDFECIRKSLLSFYCTLQHYSPQKPERKTQSPEPEKRENIPAIDWKAFCGMPKAFPHASLRKNKAYSVGQVLHFKCQKGYDKRPPTSGTRICKEENGNIIWTPLDIHCTNDS